MKSDFVGSRKLLGEITFCCLCQKSQFPKNISKSNKQMIRFILLPLAPNPTSMKQFFHLSEQLLLPNYHDLYQRLLPYLLSFTFIPVIALAIGAVYTVEDSFSAENLCSNRHESWQAGEAKSCPFPASLSKQSQRGAPHTQSRVCALPWCWSQHWPLTNGKTLHVRKSSAVD